MTKQQICNSDLQSSTVSQKGKPTSAFTTSGAGQEGWDLPELSLSGIQTWLKLRTRVLVSDKRIRPTIEC